jgi:single-stranded-DNA-specific exonuclease
LHELNMERRNIEADMQDSALISLENIDVANQYSLSIYNADYHQGVIGILASRLKEKYHRPTIVFADAGDGIVKGSGRSIANFHLRDALDLGTKRHPDLILNFGGHAMAAGLSVKQENFAAFQNAFEAVTRELLNEADLQAVMETDGNLDANDISLQTAWILSSGVWGQGFPQPLFNDGFKVISQRVVGEKHLKLILEKEQKRFDAIYFNCIDDISANIEAVYALEVNEYKGLQSLQLQIKHIE